MLASAAAGAAITGGCDQWTGSRSIAKASLKLVKAGYDRGDPKYDYTTLLQAQQVLFQAQLAQIQAKGELWRAVVEIDRGSDQTQEQAEAADPVLAALSRRHERLGRMRATMMDRSRTSFAAWCAISSARWQAT